MNETCSMMLLVRSATAQEASTPLLVCPSARTCGLDFRLTCHLSLHLNLQGVAANSSRISESLQEMWRKFPQSRSGIHSHLIGTAVIACHMELPAEIWLASCV